MEDFDYLDDAEQTHYFIRALRELGGKASDDDIIALAEKMYADDQATATSKEASLPEGEVTAVDANGDGDTDVTLTETPDETSLEVDADNKEEADAADEVVDKVLDGWDALADTMAKENPISIDKVDAMADEAAEDNPISLDKVDAMADEAALDSTGRISSKEREKLTPEQKKLEDIARRQQNITSALADTVRFS